MMKTKITAALVAATLAACGSTVPSAQEAATPTPTPTPTPTQLETQSTPPPTSATGSVAASTQAALPAMTVHKSPTCPCCTVWVEHVRSQGFDVTVNETHQVDPIRQRLGVPAGKGSCHTAEVGGLVIEGHVPAEDIKRLLADPGDAKGLVLPGMPIGSPGMESPDGRVEHYVVERINADGTTSPYAEHGPKGAL